MICDSKNYADLMRYYTYLNFIWEEKIIYLTGENLLMEELEELLQLNRLFLMSNGALQEISLGGVIQYFSSQVFVFK